MKIIVIRGKEKFELTLDQATSYKFMRGDEVSIEGAGKNVVVQVEGSGLMVLVDGRGYLLKDLADLGRAGDLSVEFDGQGLSEGFFADAEGRIETVAESQQNQGRGNSGKSAEVISRGDDQAPEVAMSGVATEEAVSLVDLDSASGFGLSDADGTESSNILVAFDEMTTGTIMDSGIAGRGDFVAGDSADASSLSVSGQVAFTPVESMDVDTGKSMPASPQGVLVKVLAGPVVAGNGLSVAAYDVNGRQIGSAAKVGADGTARVNLESYRGSVLFKVVDADDKEDYTDEAQKKDVDLDTDLRAVAFYDGNPNMKVTISPLSELAVTKMGAKGDTAPEKSEAAIKGTNKAVAKVFGADDATGGDTVAANESGYAGASESAKKYAKALVVLSGVAKSEGSVAAANKKVADLIAVEDNLTPEQEKTTGTEADAVADTVKATATDALKSIAENGIKEVAASNKDLISTIKDAGSNNEVAKVVTDTSAPSAGTSIAAPTGYVVGFAPGSSSGVNGKKIDENGDQVNDLDATVTIRVTAVDGTFAEGQTITLTGTGVSGHSKDAPAGASHVDFDVKVSDLPTAATGTPIGATVGETAAGAGDGVNIATTDGVTVTKDTTPPAAPTLDQDKTALSGLDLKSGIKLGGTADNDTVSVKVTLSVGTGADKKTITQDAHVYEDNGPKWALTIPKEAGAKLGLTGSDTEKVSVSLQAVDSSGNVSAPTPESGKGSIPDLSVDSTPPATTGLGITLNDVGSKTDDGITKNKQIQVTANTQEAQEEGGGNIKAQYSYEALPGVWSAWTDVGATNNFTLSDGTYAAGQVRVRYVDESGNPSDVVSNDRTWVIDTAGPDAPTIATTSTAVKKNETVTYTLTFTEAVADPKDAITATGGTAGTPTTTDGGKTWTVVVTPDDDTNGGTINLSVNGTNVNDIAGNAGTGTATADAVTYDTKLPALDPTKSAVASDKGPNQPNQQYDKGDTITVYLDEAVVQSKITLDPKLGAGATATVSGNAVTITLGDNPSLIPDGEEFTMGVEDEKGNTATLKVQAPSVKEVGVAVTYENTDNAGPVDQITLTFSEKLATDLSLSSITMDGNALSATDYTLTQSTTDPKKYTLTRKDNGDLSGLDGKTLVIDKTAMEGENSDGAPTPSNNREIVVDASALTVLVSNAGERDLTEQEAQSYTISGTTAGTKAGDTVTVTISDGATPTAGTKTLTAKITGTDGDWTATGDVSTLAEGALTVKVQVADAATNVSSVLNVPSLTLDKTPPPALTLALKNDTGNGADGITNDGTMQVGNMEEGAQSTFTYRVKGGDWIHNASTPTFSLGEGTYAAGDVEVAQRDGAGNVSKITKLDKTIVVDTTAPTLDKIEASTTTLKKGEKVTYTLTFSEKVTSLDTAMTGTSGGTVGDPTGSADGKTWTVEVTPTDGTDNGTIALKVDGAKVKDIAGNSVGSGMVSVDKTVKYDTNAPGLDNAKSVVADDKNTNETYDSGDTITVYLDEAINSSAGKITLDNKLGTGAATSVDATGKIVTITLGTSPGLTPQGGTFTLGVEDANGNAETLTVTAPSLQGNVVAVTYENTDNAGPVDSMILTFGEKLETNLIVDKIKIKGSDGTTLTALSGYTLSAPSTDGKTYTLTKTDGGDLSGLDTQTLVIDRVAMKGTSLSAPDASPEIVVDASAPSVSITAPTEEDKKISQTEASSFSLSGTTDGLATGDNITLTITTNGTTGTGLTSITREVSVGADGTWSATGIDLTGLKDGQLTIKAEVKDAANNQGVATDSSVSLDKTPPSKPTVALTQDTGSNADDGITNNKQITVSGFDASKGDTWEYTINGDAATPTWTKGTGTTFNLADNGVYVADKIQVRVTDGHGNEGPATKLGAITVDTSAPVVIITAPAEADKKISKTDADKKDFKLEGTVTELASGDTFTLTIASDGTGTGSASITATANVGANGAWTTGNIDLTGLKDGKLTITASAKDTAGNEGTVTNSDFTLDQTPPSKPTVALTQDTGSKADDGITNNKQITVSGFDASKGDTWEYTINGDAATPTWTKGTGTTFNLAENTAYTTGKIQVRVTDGHGNVGPATKLGAITVDNTAPAKRGPGLLHSAVNEGDTNAVLGVAKEANVTFSLGGTDAAKFNIDSTTGNITLKTGTVAGAYSVTVKATDTAGNESVSDAYSITVDAKPAVTGFSVLDDGQLVVQHSGVFHAHGSAEFEYSTDGGATATSWKTMGNDTSVKLSDTLTTYPAGQIMVRLKGTTSPVYESKNEVKVPMAATSSSLEETTDTATNGAKAHTEGTVTIDPDGARGTKPNVTFTVKRTSYDVNGKVVTDYRADGYREHVKVKSAFESVGGKNYGGMFANSAAKGEIVLSNPTGGALKLAGISFMGDNISRGAQSFNELSVTVTYTDGTVSSNKKTVTDNADKVHFALDPSKKIEKIVLLGEHRNADGTLKNVSSVGISNIQFHVDTDPAPATTGVQGEVTANTTYGENTDGGVVDSIVITLSHEVTTNLAIGDIRLANGNALPAGYTLTQDGTDLKKYTLTKTGGGDLSGLDGQALTVNKAKLVTASLSAPDTNPTLLTVDASVPTIGINNITDPKLSKAEAENLTISGTSAGAVGEVTVTISDSTRDVTAKATVNADGTWSATGINAANLDEGTLTIKASVADTATNQADATYSGGTVTLDTTVPTTPIMTYVDSGTKNQDGITKNGTITVSGMVAGDTWEYKTAAADSWTTGTGTAFTLSEGTYNASQMQVRIIDDHDNESVSIFGRKIVVDTTAPTLDNIEASSTALKKGEKVTYTLTFSEKVTSLDTAMTGTSGGTVETPTTADGGKTWTVVVTPNDNTNDGTIDLQVDKSMVKDIAGNSVGSAMVSVDKTVKYDTNAPGLDNAKSAVVNDKDTNETYDSGDTITVYLDEAINSSAGKITLDNKLGTGATTSVDATGKIVTITLGASPNLSSTGENFDLGVEDAKGNTATLSVAAPSLKMNDVAVTYENTDNAGPVDSMILTFNEELATDLTVDKIKIKDGNGALTALTGYTLAKDSNDSKKYTLTKTGGGDLSGLDGKTLVIEQAAMKGKTLVAPAAGPEIVVDASAMTVTFDTIADPKLSKAEAENLTISGTSVGAVGEEVTVTISDADNSTADVTKTVTVNADGTWSATGINAASLAEGNLTIKAEVKDTATNQADATYTAATVSLDKTPPSKPTVALTQDTGSNADDGITNNGRIKITAPNYSSVKGDSWQYKVKDGSWESGGTGGAGFSLAEGTYAAGDVQVRITDGHGNVSESGTLGAITVDTTGPTLKITAPTTEADKKISKTDADKKDFQLKGTVTELASGATFTLTIASDGTGTGSASITATASVGANGAWTTGNIDLTGLKDGKLTITASATDIAGNVGTVTNSDFSLDQTPPAKPTVALTQDTGSKADDGITNNKEITVSGFDASKGDTWEYTIIGDAATPTWTKGTGTTFNLVENTAYAADNIQVRVTDGHGNVGPATKLGAITVDNTAPAKRGPGLLHSAVNEEDTTAVLGVAKEAGVTFSLGGTDAAKFNIDSTTGNITLKTGTVAGAYSVTVKATDTAGNESVSDAYSITVDAKPAVTGFSVLDDGQLVVQHSGVFHAHGSAEFEYCTDGGATATSWKTMGNDTSVKLSDTLTTYPAGQIMVRLKGTTVPTYESKDEVKVPMAATSSSLEETTDTATNGAKAHTEGTVTIDPDGASGTKPNVTFTVKRTSYDVNGKVVTDYRADGYREHVKVKSAFESVGGKNYGGMFANSAAKGEIVLSNPTGGALKLAGISFMGDNINRGTQSFNELSVTVTYTDGTVSSNKKTVTNNADKVHFALDPSKKIEKIVLLGEHRNADGTLKHVSSVGISNIQFHVDTDTTPATTGVQGEVTANATYGENTDGGVVDSIVITLSNEVTTDLAIGDIKAGGTALSANNYTLTKDGTDPKKYTLTKTGGGDLSGLDGQTLTVDRNKLVTSTISKAPQNDPTLLTVDASAMTVTFDTIADPKISADEAENLTIKGTSAGAVGEEVTVTISDADNSTADVTKTVTVNADGTWSATGINAASLAEGNLTIKAEVKDTATNQADATYTTATVSLDKTAPTNTPTFDLTQDTGADTTDGLTNNGSITVQGFGTGDNFQYKTSTSGTWTTVTGTTFNLTDGTYVANQIEVRLMDSHGNAGPIGKLNKQIIVDTAAPNTPDKPTLATSLNAVDSRSKVLLSGSAEAGAGVEIMQGTTVVGATLADSNGNWSARMGAATVTVSGMNANVGSADLNATYNRITDPKELYKLSQNVSGDFNPNGNTSQLDTSKPVYKTDIGGETWVMWARVGSGYHISKLGTDGHLSDSTNWAWANTTTATGGAVNVPEEVPSWKSTSGPANFMTGGSSTDIGGTTSASADSYGPGDTVSFKVKATDLAGNASTESATTNITLPGSAAIGFTFNDAGTSATDGITNDGEVTVTGVHAAQGQTWQYTINGDAATPTWTTGTGTTFIVPVGKYTAGKIKVKLMRGSTDLDTKDVGITEVSNTAPPANKWGLGLLRSGVQRGDTTTFLGVAKETNTALKVLLGGTDADKFNIDAATGKITVKGNTVNGDYKFTIKTMNVAGNTVESPEYSVNVSNNPLPTSFSILSDGHLVVNYDRNFYPNGPVQFQYSTTGANSSGFKSMGDSTSVKLPAGTYAAGDIQVRIHYGAIQSGILKNTVAVTIPATNTVVETTDTATNGAKAHTEGTVTIDPDGASGTKPNVTFTVKRTSYDVNGKVATDYRTDSYGEHVKVKSAFESVDGKNYGGMFASSAAKGEIVLSNPTGDLKLAGISFMGDNISRGAQSFNELSVTVTYKDGTVSSNKQTATDNAAKVHFALDPSKTIEKIVLSGEHRNADGTLKLVSSVGISNIQFHVDTGNPITTTTAGVGDRYEATNDNEDVFMTDHDLAIWNEDSIKDENGVVALSDDRVFNFDVSEDKLDLSALLGGLEKPSDALSMTTNADGDVIVTVDLTGTSYENKTAGADNDFTITLDESYKGGHTGIDSSTTIDSLIKDGVIIID